MGEPSIYHALVVIFLEFFAWGLLTNPMISVSIKRVNHDDRGRDVWGYVCELARGMATGDVNGAMQGACGQHGNFV